jgi:hypothetical protein
MVRLEDQRNGAELEIQNGPAEGRPERKKEDNRLREEHIYTAVRDKSPAYQGTYEMAGRGRC